MGVVLTKIRSVFNILDFKDGSGKWVKSYYPTTDEHHFTRAGILWSSINSRCKEGGYHQKRKPSYIEVVNGFIDFQEFADWCQSQYGYLNKESNGKYWAIDKDLLDYNNLEYSKDKCIFVPNRINSLLIASNASRGEYPLGVYWKKSARKFAAQCSDGSGKQKYLGYFIDPLNAHKAWQRYKIQVMQTILKDDEEVKIHTKLIPIIEGHIQRISDDLENNRETL